MQGIYPHPHPNPFTVEVFTNALYYGLCLIVFVNQACSVSPANILIRDFNILISETKSAGNDVEIATEQKSHPAKLEKENVGR